MSVERKWLSGFLHFLGRTSPSVIDNLCALFAHDEKDRIIIRARYIENRHIKEIASMVCIEERQVNRRRNKFLDLILITKIN